MKQITLQLKRALRSVLFVLLLGVAGVTKGYAYRFPVVCPTGQTLYYRIIDADNHYVELTYPGEDGNEEPLVGGSGLYWWDGYEKPVGNIVIPNSVQHEGETYSVTSIDSYAFYRCSGLTGALTIPNSVTRIGCSAFSDCSGFTSLFLPSSVTYIGIATGWTSYAFDRCIGLEQIIVDEDNPCFDSRNNCNAIIQTSNNELVIGCKNTVIPNSVTSIGYGAFVNCTGLTSIEIPNSVTFIDGEAFLYCTGLTSIAILSETPPSVQVDAFFEGVNLSIPVYVPCGSSGAYSSISWGGFSNFEEMCGGTVTLSADPVEGGTMTGGGTYGENSICTVTATANEGYWFVAWTEDGEVVSRNASYSFYVTSDRTLVAQFDTPADNIVFADAIVKAICVANWDTNDDGELSYAEAATVTSLGYIFGNLHSITSFDELQYFTGLTSIGEGAFYYCSLTSIAIPNSVTSIGEEAFVDCWRLTSIEIPNSVTSIGEGAFENCRGLTSIEIPNSVTSIGGRAFYSCSGLTSIEIPNSVTSIGWWAFYGCTGLGQIIVDSENNVYDSRDNCNAIINTSSNELIVGCKNTVIPNSVTSIGSNAFCDCTGLTSIEIPNSVTSIGWAAFRGCTGLTSIEIPNSVTSIDAVAFSGCSGLTSIEIPNSVTYIGMDAFRGCTGLTSIEIPNSVTYIGLDAFSHCTGLGQIIVDSENTVYDSRDNCNAIINTSSNELIVGCKNTVIPNSVTSIGNYAFEICSGLTSIEIPNSVTSIGRAAFWGCTGLTFMCILSETPPSLGPSVFSNVNQSIPVYVPCGSSEAYSTSTTWSSCFTNYMEMCGGTVTLSVDPEEGGAVTGGGTYGENSFCTVTATANEGYRFVAWTENGEVVSTNASYSFYVTSDRTLTANFDPYYHWTPVDEGVYSCSMVLIGVVRIDGEEQYNNQLELGIFCVDECRGTCRLEEFYITGRYLAWTNVYGEEGDELTFRLYDHSSGMELVLTPPASVVFTEDGYGTPIEPYELNFYSSVTVSASVSPVNAGTVEGAGEYVFGTYCTLIATANTGFQFQNWTENDVVVSSDASYSFEVTTDRSLVAHFSRVQTSPLISGWNWWSTYIEQEGIDGLQMLENSLDGNGLRIQAKNASADYFVYEGTGSWYGALNALDNEQMYKVRTSEACEAVIVGEEALPANHPVTISEGWNWLGYPSAQSANLEVALGGFMPEPNDVIKSRNQSASYISYGGYNLWYGSLNTLEPGQGYMYKSNSVEPKTLVFQTGRGNEELKPNITPESNIYVPKGENYADNMLITAVIELAGQELRSEDYELAAFVGDECRGSVKLMYVEPFDRYMAFLLVFGDKTEDIHFVLTDGTDMSLSDDLIQYAVDGTVGTVTEPATLHFGTLGVADDLMVPVYIYPNPSEGIFNVEGVGILKVEVVDTYGQVILSTEVENDNLQINLSERAAGTYLLRIVTANGVITKKVLVL